MLSVAMNYLPEDDEVSVVRHSTSAETVALEKVIGAEDLMAFMRAVRDVAMPRELSNYVVELVASSRPTVDGCPDFVKEYVAWGAGLRASQNITLAAKSAAAQDGRATVGLSDVRKAIMPVMRHRIGLSFRAEVDRVSVEDITQRLVEACPEPAVA